MRQRSGNSDPLLFSAGEFIGKGAFTVGHAHFFEKVTSDHGRFPLRNSGQFLRQRNIFQYGKSGNQVEKLKDDANLIAPEQRPVSLGFLSDSEPINCDVTCGGLFYATDEVQQSAFTTSTLPQQRDKLTGLEIEGDVV